MVKSSIRFFLATVLLGLLAACAGPVAVQGQAGGVFRTSRGPIGVGVSVQAPPVYEAPPVVVVPKLPPCHGQWVNINGQLVCQMRGPVIIQNPQFQQGGQQYREMVCGPHAYRQINGPVLPVPGRINCWTVGEADLEPTEFFSEIAPQPTTGVEVSSL